MSRSLATQSNVLEHDEPAGTEIKVSDTNVTALGVIMSAEVDQQIATAKKFPRILSRARKRAEELACISPEVAAACNYALPRAGKTIEGPSVRLAEIIAATYGNLHTAVRIVRESADSLTAMASCWDLETNVRTTIEYSRRITGKTGQRLNDDMVNLARNDAISRAFRNAVFRVVPFPFVQAVYQKALETAYGGGEALGERRGKVLSYFKSQGIKQDEVFRLLGIEGREDMTLDHIRVLGGIANQIEDGISVEEIFRQHQPELAPVAKADRLAAEMMAKVEQKPAREPGSDDAV